MPGNSLFYAYVHNVHDHNTSRLTIVFASRHIADEWWRAISSLPDPGVAGSFQRITPQFYTHDTDKIDLFYFFDKPAFKSIAPKFKGKLFITWENDRGGRGFSVIPEQEIVDHLSGNLFYIRSKQNPDLFWNFDQSLVYPGGVISVSTASTRSRFRIIAADPTLEKGTVLIGSDEVILEVSDGLYIALSQLGKLVISSQPDRLLFSDLLGGGFTFGNGTSLFYSTDGPGDAWELL